MKKCNYNIQGNLLCTELFTNNENNNDKFIEPTDRGFYDPYVEESDCIEFAKNINLPFYTTTNRNMTKGCQVWNGNEVYFNTIGKNNCDHRNKGKCVKFKEDKFQIETDYGGYDPYLTEDDYIEVSDNNIDTLLQEDEDEDCMDDDFKFSIE